MKRLSLVRSTVMVLTFMATLPASAELSSAAMARISKTAARQYHSCMAAERANQKKSALVCLKNHVKTNAAVIETIETNILNCSQVQGSAQEAGIRSEVDATAPAETGVMAAAARLTELRNQEKHDLALDLHEYSSMHKMGARKRTEIRLRQKMIHLNKLISLQAEICGND